MTEIATEQPIEHPTEQQMRDEKAPWPKTPDELNEYIRTLVERPHDYGTCVYAMSLAAVAAFQYVAGTLGVTGFQASCADLDFLKRTRSYEHGFIVLDANNLLYPQYDLEARVRGWIEETRPKLADAARKKLHDSPMAVDAVRARWEEIASLAPAPDSRATPQGEPR